MPNPEDYKSANEFMSACITKLKSEGKSAAKAREQCAAMWYSRKNGKKKRSRSK